MVPLKYIAIVTVLIGTVVGLVILAYEFFKPKFIGVVDEDEPTSSESPDGSSGPVTDGPSDPPVDPGTEPPVDPGTEPPVVTPACVTYGDTELCDDKEYHLSFPEFDTTTKFLRSYNTTDHGDPYPELLVEIGTTDVVDATITIEHSTTTGYFKIKYTKEDKYVCGPENFSNGEDFRFCSIAETVQTGASTYINVVPGDFALISNGDGTSKMTYSDDAGTITIPPNLEVMSIPTTGAGSYRPLSLELSGNAAYFSSVKFVEELCVPYHNFVLCDNKEYRITVPDYDPGFYISNGAPAVSSLWDDRPVLVVVADTSLEATIFTVEHSSVNPGYFHLKSKLTGKYLVSNTVHAPVSPVWIFDDEVGDYSRVNLALDNQGGGEVVLNYLETTGKILAFRDLREFNSDPPILSERFAGDEYVVPNVVFTEYVA